MSKSTVPLHRASIFTWKDRVGTITFQNALAQVHRGAEPQPLMGYSYEDEDVCFDLVSHRTGTVTRFFMTNPGPDGIREDGFMKHMKFTSKTGLTVFITDLWVQLWRADTESTQRTHSPAASSAASKSTGGTRVTGSALERCGSRPGSLSSWMGKNASSASAFTVNLCARHFRSAGTRSTAKLTGEVNGPRQKGYTRVMLNVISVLKTTMFASDPATWARLQAGETLDSRDAVLNEELRVEIEEGGGKVWLCDQCEVVHSPNRPCPSDVAAAKYWDRIRVPDRTSTVPTKQELNQMREMDERYERRSRR